MFMRFASLLLCVGWSTENGARAEGECGDPGELLLTVADFDGSGFVDGNDIAMAARALKESTANLKGSPPASYFALYDRNADGKFDADDVDLAALDQGKSSTAFDQEVAAIYHKFSHLQNLQGHNEFFHMGYLPIPVALQGHGVHWFNEGGMAAMLGPGMPDFNSAQGLNIDTGDEMVHGLFWGKPAVPVFEDGADDWPYGEEWKSQRVIAFADQPPHDFTSNPHESWHTHGALCMGSVNGVGFAHQYVTYNECQEYESDMRMPDGSVMWANFWMIHVWLFNLNPKGIFAGIHPCVEQNGLPEITINGDRDVPHFFAMMNHGH